jgi:glycosyltransferase involved in cell wall biosynthesis
MKVALIWRGAVEALPAAMFLARHLARNGCHVTWISGTVADDTLSNMRPVRCIPLGIPSSGDEPPLEKAVNALRFRRKAWQEIDALGPSAVLWILNSETAIVLGRKLLHRKYVLHLYELHEPRIKRRLADCYVRGARAVVCPETNRGAIIRGWHGLTADPLVIPNVALTHIHDRYQPVRQSAIQRVLNDAVANGKRIVLYQGLIRDDRDLSVYCRFFARHGSWSLVFMGRDFGPLRRFAALCPNLIHIDHIPAPWHLQVTSWASLGIVAYNDDCLNNRFCAPNKIYEYGAFGIPMLANDVSGLRDTVGRYGAGVCASIADEDVERAVRTIEEQYDSFSAASRRLAEEAAASIPAKASKALELCR